MKKWTKTAGSAILAGTILAGGLGGTGLWPGNDRAYAAVATTAVTNAINVSAQGELYVKPDIAYLSIGVQSQASTAAAAQKANATKVNKITALLKNTWSISGDDIQTSQFYVQPNYTYDEKDGQKLNGYTANHMLAVKYRDLDKIGKLLDEATKAGASNVDNIRFGVKDPSSYEEQVIAKAMASAQSKAGAVAKAANRKLGSLLNVTIDDSNARVYTQMEGAMLKSAGSASSDATQVQTGQVTVSVQLSAQYAME